MAETQAVRATNTFTQLSTNPFIQSPDADGLGFLQLVPGVRAAGRVSAGAAIFFGGEFPGDDARGARRAVGAAARAATAGVRHQRSGFADTGRPARARSCH